MARNERDKGETHHPVGGSCYFRSFVDELQRIDHTQYFAETRIILINIMNLNNEYSVYEIYLQNSELYQTQMRMHPINSLDVASSGSRILHGKSQTMIRTDDIQSSNGLSGFRIVLALLIDHIQLHGEFAIRISDYGIRESARDVLAVRLDVLRR